MTTERNVEPILRHWLVDGVDEMPERVYLSILDRVERQPQRRAWRLPWRDSHVNAYLKPAIAVGAVILVAVVGFSVLRPPSGSNVGGNAATPSPSPIESASASPTASASPSARPSPSAVFPAWYSEGGEGAGILSAGSQTTRQYWPGATFTVPEGWVNSGDYAPAYYLFPDTPANQAEYARSRQVAQVVYLAEPQNNMFAICEATGLFDGTTATGIIDAVVANKALSSTHPADVTIGGLSGRQVDVQLNRDWTGRCPLRPEDPSTMDYTDVRNRLIMLDAPHGSVIGIQINSLYSADFEAFLAKTMPIVESFRLDLGPEASPS